jgi:hypothetical protein
MTPQVIKRLEELLSLLDDLKSPKDSIKKEYHQKFFSHLKFKTFQNDFNRLINFKIIKPLKTKKQWTSEEDQILIKYSKKMKLDDVRKKHLPHRTIHMLRHRSRQLKLNLHQYSITPWTKHWTPVELYILRQGGDMEKSIPEIMERLPDRTEMGISLKLWNLGYKTKKHKDEDYEKRDWEKWELRVLKKWYPLVGTGSSLRREIIGTPDITDFLPNRTKNSIRLKSERLGYKYDTQKDLDGDEKRCVLCLKVKKLSDFPGRKQLDPYCKTCMSEINYNKLYVRKDFEPQEILGISLQKRYITDYDDFVSRLTCINNVNRVIKKYGYKCFFNDQFCDNRHLKNLTIDHIIPVSRFKNKYQMIDPENLLIMCCNHNSIKNDLTLDELKLELPNISKVIKDSILSNLIK